METTKQIKVLLIDDEQDLSWLFSKRLMKMGYDVYTYGKGEAAISRIQECTPDIILLDIKLPGRSGIDVYQEMKGLESLHAIPVIFLSALHNQEDYCLNTLKAAGFLKKPCSAQEIISAITKTIAVTN